MAMTTYKHIKLGDRFGAINGTVGTVSGLTWIDRGPVTKEVQIRTQHGFEIHPISDTVFILHEANESE